MGDLNIVVHLLDIGLEPNFVAEGRFTPVHIASEHGHVDILETLISRKGCASNTEYYEKLKPLHLACANGHLEVVRLLCNKGEELLCPDIRGFTPLHYAANHGHLEIVIELINRGSVVNCVNAANKTPLHIASQNGHHTIVRVLLNHGADINAQDLDYQTPLNLAESNGHHKIVKLLDLVDFEMVDHDDDYDMCDAGVSNGNELKISSDSIKIADQRIFKRIFF